MQVLHRELRESREFQEALASGEISEATSDLRRRELLDFVKRNLGCNSTSSLEVCFELEALDMSNLAKLWNRVGPLLGGEKMGNSIIRGLSTRDHRHSPEHVSDDGRTVFQEDSGDFQMIVAIYANNRPHYLQQVLFFQVLPQSKFVRIMNPGPM